MQINHNVAALNAWRNLGVSSNSLGSTLEKLSSGYRINRGADDPAGLLISEQLRAQIGGLDQASRNASDAVSMVQTAEGALTEMNTMLNSIRSLAVHAANTGSNDSTSIAADQTAVDKAIDSIQRIATTTKYAGKTLLDGSAGTTITDALGTTLTDSTVGTVVASGNQNLQVNTVATQGSATVSLAGTGNAFTAAIAANATITVWATVGGTAMTSKTYTAVAGQTYASFAAIVNADKATTGVRLSNVVAATNAVAFIAEEFGNNAKVNIVYGSGFNGVTSGNATTSGVSVTGSIAGVTLDGSGLILYGSAGSTWANTQFNLTSAAGKLASTYIVSITVADLKFSLTQDGSTSSLISYGIDSMQTAKLGKVSTLVGSTLNAIKSGGTYALATAAGSAVSIIDQAITDVSQQRAELGAFQKFTLETTINSLGVTRENLAASESRIRDVDMAKEMMEFTKNQILVQAGTAMLAQANQLPSSILQLLK